MPTTRLKNVQYRLMLPFFAPRPGKDPLIHNEGHPVRNLNAFLRIIRRHHVLGSATLMDDGSGQALLLTRSQNPCHVPEPGTFFRVASITKIAASAVAMRMTEEGLLDLDGEILPLLPAVSGLESLRGITLRQLLSHTSGLLDPETLERDLNEGKPLTETLKSVRRLAPGSGFHYSNLGYGILGCVMESVLNQPVGRIFEEWLFKPLGMHASLGGLSLPVGKIMPVARVFVYHEGQDVVLTPLGSRPVVSADPILHFGYTAGSMYIDVRSLYALMRMLLLGGNGFLKESSVREMCREHASYGKLSPTLSYGLGLLRVHDSALAARDLIGHQGFAYGCVDGAFWEEGTGRLLLFLNGGCSEARKGRLGLANRDMARWAFRKEFPSW